MSDTNPLIETRVLVPSERLADFYTLTGRWLRGEAVLLGGHRRSGRSRRSQGPDASSYAPLGEHLRTLDAAEVTLSFAHVETILARPLPTSARKHRAWWANSATHSQAVVWLAAGWRVGTVDLAGGAVSFVRDAGHG